MNLIKITELSTKFDLSSRTLRYYEEVGLIQSVRPPFEKYRYYDEENVERLRQIMVLRKLQIPIKDIVRIYESREMSTITQVFMERIDEIDQEIDTLSELKQIVSEFVTRMNEQGIKHISALPLLYEEMDRQLAGRQTLSYEQLEQTAKKLSRTPEITVVTLPHKRVLASDKPEFTAFLQQNGMEAFTLFSPDGELTAAEIPEDFENNSGFDEQTLNGGDFAAANLYLDESIEDIFAAVLAYFDDNKFYQIDYASGGSLRQPPMLRELRSPDELRQMATLYIPIKKRTPDAGTFPPPKEIFGLTPQALDEANPILWTLEAVPDRLTPINRPHFVICDNGEVEFSGTISTRTLNTNIHVKPPFRVDIEFRIPMTDARFGYGSDEGSIIFYHGDNNGYENGSNLNIMGFGINMDNHADHKSENIAFHQPIFHDRYVIPGKGGIIPGEYNRLTWIIGQKTLAVIINGEVRYAGENFAYMHLPMQREEASPVVIGSNGSGLKYFRSIKVSQLLYQPEYRLQKQALTLPERHSNGMIPTLHRLITDEYGENHWFNGCACYVMECYGEKDFDYPFFALLTGDDFVQYYRQPLAADSVSECMHMYVDTGYLPSVFAKCGYAADFVPCTALAENTEAYLNRLISHIDRGIPVIYFGGNFGGEDFTGENYGGGDFGIGVFVGYEDYGKTLLYITGNEKDPKRIPLEKAVKGCVPDRDGWIFVTEKVRDVNLADVCREAVYAIPDIMDAKYDDFYLGGDAFRAWANDLEHGYFDTVTPDKFDAWNMHTNFHCTLATNGSCAPGMLKKTMELNPDMMWLEDVIKLYERQVQIWMNDNGRDLEAIGGGFNVTLEALQDPEKRMRIAARYKECGANADKVAEIIRENRKEYTS